jgi:hypothetical protein
MAKMLHCGVAAFSIPLQLLELLWWACCRHVKQTATTLDEKIPIDSGFCTVPMFLFVCLFLQIVQIINECAIILEFKLLVLLCSRLAAGT